MKVLFVEDDDMCRKLGLKVLALFDNIEVMDATNGYDALELYENNPFDLIIVDLDLPDITGSEVVTLIKNRYKERPPAIAITAHLDNTDKVPNNIDKLYTKPLTYNMFKEILTLVS